MKEYELADIADIISHSADRLRRLVDNPAKPCRHESTAHQLLQDAMNALDYGDFVVAGALAVLAAGAIRRIRTEK